MDKKPYYGLRLMSLLYQALAVVIAIFAIASAGAIWADASITGNELLSAGVPWTVRAGMTLGIGFLIALTCYVLSQLIDAQLETLKNSQVIAEQMQTLQQMQATQAKMFKLMQRSAAKTGNPIPMTDEDELRVREQLAERASKLRSKE